MIIQANNISKQFLRKREDSNVFYAVEPTDFTLESGKITAISGSSGSGKSTLLNMLSGILEPTSGEILFGENNVYQMNDKELSEFRNRHYGVIPQGQTAIQSLTVLENVMLPVTLYKTKSNEYLSKAKALLERMGIADLENVMPSELSGGEMRRMAIARALIRDPEVILADEPTADLDEENTRIVMDVLREEADAGKAVLIVTHEKEVFSMADISYKMRKGVIEKWEL